MKKCFKCGIVKPLAEFYRHPEMADGRLNKCMECTKRDTRENCAKRRDYYIEYNRQRQRRPERREAKRRYVQKAFANDPEKINGYKKAWIERNPEKRKAHNAVSNALRSGKITRQPCEICSEPKTEAHHDDYSKPLEIRWLCNLHHHTSGHKHLPPLQNSANQ